jgi:hypothetical protein
MLSRPEQVVAVRSLALGWFIMLLSSLALGGCVAASDDIDSEELQGAEESPSSRADGITGSLPVGATLKSTTGVNLRTGPSTSNSILHVVPSGAQVTLQDSTPSNGFYKVKHGGTVGWSYGQYYTLVASGSGSWGSCSVGGETGTCIDVGSCAAGNVSTPGYCPGPANVQCCTPTISGSGSGSITSEAIARAESAKGFSYWWGHARFRPEGPTSSNAGSCSGSCPSCSHSGSYGGDCSGLAGKVWQVPSSNSDLTIDSHPYGTIHFNQDSSQWSTVSRSSVKEADAMVYNIDGAGHIFIYESGDGWGSMYAHECKGCSYGCVSGYRTATSSYHAIRRAGY